MPEDFLAESNVAGHTLLRLVSRGNAIIAEILRLSDFVPPEFRLATKEDQRKYGEIILDFSYFKASEFCDQRIENNPELLERDDDFRDNNLPLLNRFYLLFEGIYKYVKDLTRYLEDLDQGVFIQQTLESVFATFDGKQLLVEALYLYGVMLLILDQRIEGLVRERMLVSYSRYKSASATSTNLDDVCKLVRSTGFAPGAPKKPAEYPEEYFKRYPLPKQYISMAIGRLRSDDIYGQITAYPNPDHRSTALATQASMLYVILYFAPELLHHDQAKMREIVDKHFPDNWVITYYMGFLVDLAVAWDGYKAARNALANTLALPNVQQVYQRNLELLESVSKELEAFLVEGVLIESYVLDRIPKLMNTLRDANVTLRWLMLHTNTRVPKLKQVVTPGFAEIRLVLLLINTSHFEFLLKNMFSELLRQKPQNWDDHKKESIGRMVELAEVFSGEKALSRVSKNENLQAWFNDIAGQISSLEYADATMAGRKIVQLMQALDEVQEFHQLESNLQVRAFLADTKGYLLQILRTVNVKEEILITIQLVGDLSYGWELMGKYVPLMQNLIKKDPTVVIKLRAMFLKLASILDLPLVRISQANSRDVVSVAEYYSGQLVEFVRRVLQIIPKSMFEVLNEIVEIQTLRLQEVPTRLEKERLKDFSQLNERYALARRTYSISVYTEGMLAMETTLVGVVEVDPKQLLEDGIRRELVTQVATAMDRILVFGKVKNLELEGVLSQLATKLDGFRRSFEYIQDYVNIYALKIWQEELSRIINYNVERECNSFLKTKVFEWESPYQSVAIPIPNFPPSDDQSVNFIGRLAREILNLTDVKKTVFVHQMSAWYDRKTLKEVVGLKTFSQLFQSVGTFGLTGLDKLYSFMIVRVMQKFASDYRTVLKGDKNLRLLLQQTHDALEPVTALTANFAKLYPTAIGRLPNLSKIFTDYIVRVGHLQLLRRMIANELNFRCKLDSQNLAGTLQYFNDSLVIDIKNHYRDTEAHPYPKDDNPLLSELAGFLEASGINDPFLKIYITTVPLEYFPLVVFLYVIAQINKFGFDPATSTFLYKGKNEPLDGAPFVIGIITLLKQFHLTHTKTFLAYLGQYIRTLVNAAGLKEPRPREFPLEVSSSLSFLEEFCKYSRIPRKVVEAFVPAFLFNQCSFLTKR